MDGGSGARACVLCGHRSIPVHAHDWPWWVHGRPVHAACYPERPPPGTAADDLLELRARTLDLREQIVEDVGERVVRFAERIAGWRARFAGRRRH